MRAISEYRWAKRLYTAHPRGSRNGIAHARGYTRIGSEIHAPTPLLLVFRDEGVENLVSAAQGLRPRTVSMSQFSLGWRALLPAPLSTSQHHPLLGYLLAGDQAAVTSIVNGRESATHIPQAVASYIYWISLSPCNISQLVYTVIARQATANHARARARR